MKQVCLSPPAECGLGIVDGRESAVDVLHVPYTYFPDAVGGTELYVQGLVIALSAHGLRCAVAIPGRENEAYVYDGIPVFRFAHVAVPSFESAYGAPDEDAVVSFRDLLVRVQPRVVHFHARTAAVSERLVDSARDEGAKIVFTYHTPTMSCARGTMMRTGREPCDGKLDVRRCTACVLQSHGVPLLMRDALAMAPQMLGKALERAKLAGGIFTALRMSALVGASHRRFFSFVKKVDHVVAVCDWVAEVLRINGVPEKKVTKCRQGFLAGSPVTMPAVLDVPSTADGTLRLGYFGRLDPTKGVDVLIEALRLAPHVKVRLAVYGVIQRGSEAYAARLKSAAGSDGRVAMIPALPASSVLDAMGACDFVAVPSRCLETGPLVVLESFAAGVPVLGARLGGIAELVTDGVDGVLIKPDHPAAWSSVIAELAGNPDRVARLRAGVHPPRTMDDVAREMATVYRAVLHDAR